MRNLKLTLQYHGADFHGWQKQTGTRTVQGELETAFFQLFGQHVDVEGSGRTDAGVHALAQVASVKIENNIPLKNLKRALNDVLPSDVRISKVEHVEDDFHARFAAKKKTYKYMACVGGTRPALWHNTVGFFGCEVDLKKMQAAANLLLGKHNFKGFCSAHTVVKDFEREIFDILIKKRGRVYTFEVSGNGFLYNMVRIIVGTLLEVGCGKKSEEHVKKALETGDRKFAGKTMAACGLYLKNVEYLND